VGCKLDLVETDCAVVKSSNEQAQSYNTASIGRAKTATTLFATTQAQQSITFEQGVMLKKHLHLDAYIECSAATQDNIEVSRVMMFS
jgi:hypothetical protein